MSEQQLSVTTNPAFAAATAAAADPWQQLSWLPCQLSLEVPVPQFTVRDLLRLRSGSVVPTSWSRSREVPLHANGELIGWAEFEAVESHIGARITELV
jgi:flagellar motor switch/type III secretory pathway protein FliN